MINKTLFRRLETLEDRLIPDEEPTVLDVVFIDAATKQATERPHLKLGYAQPPERSGTQSRTAYR